MHHHLPRSIPLGAKYSDSYISIVLWGHLQSFPLAEQHNTYSFPIPSKRVWGGAPSDDIILLQPFLVMSLPCS